MHPSDKPRLIRKVSGFNRKTLDPFTVDHGEPIPENIGISGYTLFMREYSERYGHLDHWICFHEKLKDSIAVFNAIRHCQEIQEIHDDTKKNQAA